MSAELEYIIYNKHRLAVRGDRNKYQDLLKNIGGRWNSRMRGGEGWLVPIEHKEELDAIINGITENNIQNETEEDLQSIESDEEVISSTKTKKYHREQSESEEESEEEDDESEESEEDEEDEEEGEEEGEGEESEQAGSEEEIEENKDNEEEDESEDESNEELDENSIQLLNSLVSKPEMQDHVLTPNSHTDKRSVEPMVDCQSESEQETKHTQNKQERKLEKALKKEQHKREKEERRRAKEEVHHKEDKHRKKEDKRNEEKIRMKEEIRRLEREKAERRAQRKQKVSKYVQDTEQYNNHESSHKRKESHNKRKTKHQSGEDQMEYYRAFAKKPLDFQEIYGVSDSEDFSSSNESESESSDDFPSPETPVKRRGKKTHTNDTNHGDLFEKVKDLQRRLYEMEIQNRKLKAYRHK